LQEELDPEVRQGAAEADRRQLTLADRRQVELRSSLIEQF
jgi:hypothetical protein